jgi:hypothetical protein
MQEENMITFTFKLVNTSFKVEHKFDKHTSMFKFIRIMESVLLDEWDMPQHTTNIEILDTSTSMHEQFKPALEADPDITLLEKYGAKGIHNVAFYGRPVIYEVEEPPTQSVEEESPTQEEEPVVDNDDEESLQQEDLPIPNQQYAVIHQIDSSRMTL